MTNKKIIQFLIVILWCLVLLIPILNLLLVYKATRPTLANWTNHKSLLWITDFEKINVIYCTGNGYITLYQGEFGLFDTCIDSENYNKYKHIWNAEIKYIKGYEDDHLVIQLWNTKKLNKMYGVKNDK